MRNRSVLVCEDDDSLREVVSQVIEASGFDVVAVDTGAAPLHALTMTEFACAFLDIDLPDMPGFEVARRARALLPHQPRLVALAGSVSRRDFLASRDAGFDLHLTKPIELAQIRAALANLRVGSAP